MSAGSLFVDVSLSTQKYAPTTSQLRSQLASQDPSLSSKPATTANPLAHKSEEDIEMDLYGEEEETPQDDIQVEQDMQVDSQEASRKEEKEQVTKTYWCLIYAEDGSLQVRL